MDGDAYAGRPRSRLRPLHAREPGAEHLDAGVRHDSGRHQPHQRDCRKERLRKQHRHDRFGDREEDRRRAGSHEADDPDQDADRLRAFHLPPRHPRDQRRRRGGPEQRDRHHDGARHREPPDLVRVGGQDAQRQHAEPRRERLSDAGRMRPEAVPQDTGQLARGRQRQCGAGPAAEFQRADADEHQVPRRQREDRAGNAPPQPSDEDEDRREHGRRTGEKQEGNRAELPHSGELAFGHGRQRNEHREQQRQADRRRLGPIEEGEPAADQDERPAGGRRASDQADDEPGSETPGEADPTGHGEKLGAPVDAEGRDDSGEGREEHRNRVLTPAGRQQRPGEQALGGEPQDMDASPSGEKTQRFAPAAAGGRRGHRRPRPVFTGGRPRRSGAGVFLRRARCRRPPPSSAHSGGGHGPLGRYGTSLPDEPVLPPAPVGPAG